jgi:hypothetical protein
VPGNSVADTFAGRPPVQRQIYEAILARLRPLGPLHIDAVRVGVFLKNEQKLGEIRPMARALSLLLFLPYPIEHVRILRRETVSTGRVMHTIRLTAVSEVDDELAEWLAQAYDEAS